MIRPCLRFGEARTTTEVMVDTLSYESFESCFAARMITQLDYFEFSWMRRRQAVSREMDVRSHLVRHSTKTEDSVNEKVAPAGLFE